MTADTMSYSSVFCLASLPISYRIFENSAIMTPRIKQPAKTTVAATATSSILVGSKSLETRVRTE